MGIVVSLARNRIELSTNLSFWGWENRDLNTFDGGFACAF